MTAVGRQNRRWRLGVLSELSLAVICLLMLPSAVLHGFMGIDERTAFGLLAPVALLAIAFGARPGCPQIVAHIIIWVLFLGLLASGVADGTSQVLMGGVLATSLFLGFYLYIVLGGEAVLRWVTYFTLAMLIGGLVGIVYSSLGLPPMLEVAVGYRTTYLYGTTFSLSQLGTFIRPSGVFDEPGAFAMYAALVTMFNETLRQNQRLNAAIVCLIVVTGSLAGLVLALLYFLTSASGVGAARRRRRAVFAIIAAGLAMLILIPDNPVVAAIDTFYSERLVVVDGRVVGDNRSNQILDFFAGVNADILIYGARNSQNVFFTEDSSSNPFSITYSYGLVISIPYFMLLLWLLWVIIRDGIRRSYAPLGLLLLLLQRPYIYHMSWAVFIAATVWLIYFSRIRYGATRGTSAEFYPNGVPQRHQPGSLQAPIGR